MKRFFSTAAFLALLTNTAPAQTYSLDWSAITSGAGTLTHGGYSLDGSIGDTSAGPSSNSQGYSLAGGFVAGGAPSALPKWVLRATNGPPARYANAMTYDSARGVTVMYGGGQVVPNVGYVGFGEVWEWNGAQWNQRTTYASSNAWHQDINGYWRENYNDTPAARLQHAMAYDSRRGRVVMFGGRGAGPDGGDYAFGDTWEWDGLRWYSRATNGPPAQFDHHMAYDESRGVTVLYGGFGASAALVWEWDGSKWASVSPTNGPVTSYYQDAGSMDYDSSLGQVFFGPATDGASLSFFFSWDGQQWQSRGTGFSAATYPAPNGAMVFDNSRQRSFYFGGRNNGFNDGWGGNTSAFYNARDGWSQVNDAATTSSFTSQDLPNPTDLAAKFSAQGSPLSSFLWNQFSNTTQVVLTNPASTSDQITAALVPDLNRIIKGNSIYDSARFANVVLSTETTIFQSINPVGTDLVRFNRLLLEDAYPSDMRRSPSTPTGRHYHAMAFDSARHVVVLEGGLYAYPSLIGNETWELLSPDELVIEQQPLSEFRHPGESALFTVGARSRTGAVLSYQWFFGAQPLNDGGRISGAHAASLQIAGVVLGDAGLYQVRVSDELGTVDSLPARLSLDPNLQIFKIKVFSLLWGLPNQVLQQSDVLTGNWSVVPGATSPFNVSGSGPGKFFRLGQIGP